MDLAALENMELGAEVVDETEQQRQEWMEKRSGRITCSQFPVVMATGRGKEPFSVKAYTYLKRKVAERLGSWVHPIASAATSWGNEHEAEAIDAYRELTGHEMNSEPFQFYERGDMLGGTPDGFVQSRQSGCLEIKCPYDPAVHINTLLTGEIPTKYFWQVVGHCLVTGLQWCDFMSFDPRLSGPERVVRIRWERSEKTQPQIMALSKRLNEAGQWVKETEARIRGRA